MDLQLTISGRGHTTRQLYRQLRTAILDGRLAKGQRLPSSRELAAQLAIARKTVTNIYDLLIAEGYLETRIGAGTYVASVIPANADATHVAESPIAVPENWTSIGRSLTTVRAPVAYDFDVGVPDVSRVPFKIWRSILASRSRLLSRNAAAYASPRGYKPLREAIAKYAGFTRAVVCSANDIVVTNGAQQGFDLIARILISPGAVVAMEHPGYERARWLFEMHGARIAEIPVDKDGIIVDEIPDDARLVYVTPSHQFPIGVRMSLGRRLALIEWAAARGAAIIEDDYDTEFRFQARPLDSLQSLDRHGVVIYVGTFSKVLFPGVRIGFVVAPKPVSHAIQIARELSDWHGPVLIEATLARFIEEGHLARHIRKMRRIYSARREALLTSIGEYMSNSARCWPATAGLHLGVSLERGVSAFDLARAALAAGVRIMPFSEDGFALGYGAIEEERIEGGIRILRDVLKMI